VRCGRGPATVVAARDDATHDARDAVIVERWQTLRKRRPGPLGRARKAGVRATPIHEDIWCEKIHGCSSLQGSLLNRRYAYIASKVRFA
jgi:hypothetical protein